MCSSTWPLGEILRASAALSRSTAAVVSVQARASIGMMPMMRPVLVTLNG
jgi:hypothetical protein